MTDMATAASAPGKVLLAGGYLVVDRNYTGLVFGLDARMYVRCETLKTSPGVSLSEIIVRSPQFRDAEWRYGYRLKGNHAGIEVVQLKGHTTSSQSSNKFVETALTYALSYISKCSSGNIGPAHITILADSDYYSPTMTSVPKGRFIDFGVPLREAHKTGLGSSAALVTAFTAAVLAHYLPVEPDLINTEAGKVRIHNLAQVAHCAAQGKIGSGFDVATAVYGACRYRRFDPGVLQRIGEAGSSGFAGRLYDTVNDTGAKRIWDTEIDKTSALIPEGLRLLMCDVDCGSETPGMVKKVFEWRKNHKEQAGRIWATLQKENEELAQRLQDLAKKESTTALHDLQLSILRIRDSLREMSEKAAVPIEPKVQTELIDSCCSHVKGVIGGVVPGAGGFDAIAFLIEDRQKVIDDLSEYLASHQVSVGEGEQQGIGKVRLLDVKQDMVGVKNEDVSIFNGWL